MQDTELFIHVAEIAGVFVGFGALIGIRSGPMRELTRIRWVVSTGIWVVIAALVPIIASRYGVSGHELWLLAALLAFIFFAGIFAVIGMSREAREDRATAVATTPPARILIEVVPTIWLPLAALIGALGTVVIGLLPDQEEAIYLTALGLGLFMGAMGLFDTVFMPGASRAA